MNAYARNPEAGLFRYGSAKTVYTERLIDGRLLCADLRANGVPVASDHEDRFTPSFGFEIDGEDMTYGWKNA